MFPRWIGRPLTSHLTAISTLVFHHTAVFLLLTPYCEGQTQMVSPSKPILAMVGDDVILPCHLKPATDVAAKTIEWTRLNLNPRFVLLRRDGVEIPIFQNPLYIGRTSVSTNQLKQGDISMKLSEVKISDEGTYKCHVPKLGSSTVDVIVGALSSPVVIIAAIDKAKSTVVLQCKSAGWYPEPEVFWLDGEGNLSAGPPETVRGPDDLYTVSSRVTVEKRHSNSFTCRVTQKNINQTRETNIQILEDVFVVPSCSSRYQIVVCCIFILFFSTVSFLVGGLLQIKESKTKHHNDGTEVQPGETVHFISGTNEEEEERRKKLQEREEERTGMIDVISVLREQKEEQEMSRDELVLHLEELEEQIIENEKNLYSVDVKYRWDNHLTKGDLLEDKRKLQQERTECKKSLKVTEKTLKDIEEMIARMTERKSKVEKQTDQSKQLE